jgi:ABC-type transporter MlaC component
MTKTYGVLFEQYNGETIQFHCPIRELSNGSAHRVEVDSTVHHPNKPDNEVRFRLMEREGAWFVYDLIIDNISLVESYRQVFAESLSQKKSFEAFLSDLHRKNCTEKGVCA